MNVRCYLLIIKKKSIINKKIYFRWSLLNIIIPLIMTPISIINARKYIYFNYIEMMIFIILSIINTILIKFKFDEK